jgi:hypothetical protein
MRNRLKKDPKLFMIVIISLIGAVAFSLLYAKGDNFLGETGVLFSFFLSLAILSKFFDSNRCVSIFGRTAASGAIAGAVYWLVITSSEYGLIASVLYGALIAVIWVFVEGTFTGDSCT